MRQPVLKIHQITPIQRDVNPVIAIKLSPIDTSADPKNAHLNPEIRYTTGLKCEITCHTGGNIEIE